MSSPGHRLIVWFCATILVPGLLLTLFGVRSLLQERQRASQQVRERLERAAELGIRDLERELRDWSVTVDSGIPARLLDATNEPGAAVIIRNVGGRTEASPAAQLLYSPAAADTVTALDSEMLARAESLELKEKDYRAARIAYQRVLRDAQPAERADVLHRIARTARKEGRALDAVRLYTDLLKSTAAIGSLPAALVARYELCSLLAAQNEIDRAADSALELYANLVSGTWRVDRSRYEFYAESARGWIAAVPRLQSQLARQRQVEERKRALTEVAVAAFDTAGPRRDTGYIVFRHAGPRNAVVVLSKAWAASHLWPDVFGSAVAPDLDVTLADESGRPLFTETGGQPHPTPSMSVSRDSTAAGASWRVRVSPRDPAGLAAQLDRRQAFYVTTMVLVVALLIFGTVLTLRVVKKELEVARLQAQFVSTVSHEFRSPLTGIRQMGEMLLRGRVPTAERRQTYYDRIVRESDRLSRLVENLLDVARMDDGRKAYRFAELEPTPWLKAVVNEAQSHLGEGKTIVATIPDALPPLIADREALSCAVHNLIDNAAKYSPESDVVWIESDADAGSMTIRVRDRGVGIPPDERARVFDRFYRGRDSITRQVKGAGLGLSLVKHIVTAHGGRVGLDSRTGEGSTFFIQLNADGSHPGR